MTPTAPVSPALRLLEDSGLASSHEPISATLVGTLLDEHFALGGRLERVATEKDDTFRLTAEPGDYLVKVSPPAESEADVGLQTAALRFLERTAPHLPIQRVIVARDEADHVRISTSDGGIRILRLFGFIDGVVLARTSPDAAQLGEVGAILGRIDVALQTFDPPATRQGLVWDIRNFSQLAELVDGVLDALQRRLANDVLRLFGDAIGPRLNELESQVIHGDYSPHNVIVAPQARDFVTGVIDFGDTVHSAVIFDPAVCMANLLGRDSRDPWRDACAFAAGYDRERPIARAELPLLPVAALARLTLRALIANWRAERVPQRRDYLRAHAKDDWINLERAMAVPIDDVITRLWTNRRGGGR